VGEQQGKAFVCMELVDGLTVEKMIEKEGKIGAAVVAAIVEQVLSALELAHGKRIIHRDIKPANIMVTRDGTVKVMDFGLARRVAGPDKTTMIVGSPPYMAPEQFVGKNLDGRTDLFALAASMYEMLTGQFAFPGMARIEPPAAMRSLSRDIPVALDGIVTRALEFDKDKRFASAAEMAIPLRAFLMSTGPVELGAAVAAGSAIEPAPVAAAEPAPGSPPSQGFHGDELPLGQAKPVSEELSLGEAKPVLQELSFGEVKPAAPALSFAEAKGAEVRFSLDSEESGPVYSAPIVEGLPEAALRAGRTTPRVPTVMAGSSVGAYRMVRPSEPEVFTPPPSLRAAASGGATPGPVRKGAASGEPSSGERHPATPSPRPSLTLATKPGMGEPLSNRSPVPATGALRSPGGLGSRPSTPSPAPRKSPNGTGLGVGSGRPAK
jgi:hypothetical protein